MQIKSKYLLIAIFILVAGILAVTVSYIGAQIESKGVKPTEVKTGKLNLELSDDSLNVDSLKPIYDKNYLTGSYKKEFTLTNNSDSLNSCTTQPQSTIMERNDIKLELIDSPGNSDSNNNDEENLKVLVDYLRNKKELNQIFLVYHLKIDYLEIPEII